MISDKTATIIIGVVTAIWALNILAAMFEFNNYQPSESINGIFMAVVGGAFALRHRSASGDKDKGGDHKR
jgi:uncharacterized membrane protein YeaQ/YmgE (transglycosylase-associated protein family)